VCFTNLNTNPPTFPLSKGKEEHSVQRWDTAKEVVLTVAINSLTYPLVTHSTEGSLIYYAGTGICTNSIRSFNRQIKILPQLVSNVTFLTIGLGMQFLGTERIPEYLPDSFTSAFMRFMNRNIRGIQKGTPFAKVFFKGLPCYESRDKTKDSYAPPSNWITTTILTSGLVVSGFFYFGPIAMGATEPNLSGITALNMVSRIFGIFLQQKVGIVPNLVGSTSIAVAGQLVSRLVIPTDLKKYIPIDGVTASFLVYQLSEYARMWLKGELDSRNIYQIDPKAMNDLIILRQQKGFNDDDEDGRIDPETLPPFNQRVVLIAGFSALTFGLSALYNGRGLAAQTAIIQTAILANFCFLREIKLFASKKERDDSLMSLCNRVSVYATALILAYGIDNAYEINVMLPVAVGLVTKLVADKEFTNLKDAIPGDKIRDLIYGKIDNIKSCIQGCFPAIFNRWKGSQEAHPKFIV